MTLSQKTRKRACATEGSHDFYTIIRLSSLCEGSIRRKALDNL